MKNVSEVDNQTLILAIVAEKSPTHPFSGELDLST
jgi:hypothetical protein